MCLGLLVQRGHPDNPKLKLDNLQTVAVIEATRTTIDKVYGSAKTYVTHIDTELCNVWAMQLGRRMHFSQKMSGSGSVKPELGFHWFPE